MSFIGANFEFYPPGCHLTVVEPNPFFEPLFFERQAKHPSIKMDKFVLGTAEDMKGIEDSSIDAVVSTLVLCSVDCLEKTLKEVQRVLAPVSTKLIMSSNYTTKLSLISFLLVNRVENFTIGNMFMMYQEHGFIWFKTL